jgi:hypothetical protein
MSFFKVQAERDTLYIEARNQEMANDKLQKFCGVIPSSLLKWEEVDFVPEGEACLGE